MVFQNKYIKRIGGETIFKDIVAANFQNRLKKNNHQIEEAQLLPKRMNMNKSTSAKPSKEKNFNSDHKTERNNK